MGDTSAWFTLAPLVSALPRDLVIVGEEPVVLVELGVVEQGYDQPVLAVGVTSAGRAPVTVQSWSVHANAAGISFQPIGT